MLTQFIQLKLIKSHPNLQRTISAQTQNPKFSLQFSKNTPFLHFQQHQQIFPKTKQKNHPIYQDKTISSQNIKSNFISSNHQSTPGSQYFVSRQSSKNHPNHWSQVQNISNKIPLILSPRKKKSLSKQKASLSKRSPLFSSSNNKLIRQNSLEKVLFKKDTLNSISPDENSLTKRKPLLSSLHNVLFKNQQQNQKCGQRGKKRYIFKSMSHQNLSPLKQKLYKINNQINYKSNKKYALNRFSSQRNLERSDSFKRAIEQSRQKKKAGDYEKQNQINEINTEYYVGGKNKRQKKSSNVQNNCFKLQKVIKNPIKKPSCFQQLYKKDQAAQKMASLRKKADSIIDESVNNSNIFSIRGQGSNYLNMEPY